MSLGATHIRFAIDLKARFDVKNVEEYIMGTLYPDSRILTGIDRACTHNGEVLEIDFQKDDFTKGWQIHQACDKLFVKYKYELLPDILQTKDSEASLENWLKGTAVKIIMDKRDAEIGKVRKYLFCLNKEKNPNNEDKEKIKEYHQAVIGLYDRDYVSYKDYKEYCSSIKLEKSKTKSLMELLRDYNNPDLKMRIYKLYDLMLDSFEKEFAYLLKK